MFLSEILHRCPGSWYKYNSVFVWEETHSSVWLIMYDDIRFVGDFSILAYLLTYLVLFVLVSTLGQGSPCCSVLGQSLNMSPCPVVLLRFFIHWSSPGLFWFSLFLFPVGVHFIATIGMEVGCILFIHVHVYLAVHSKIIIDEKSLVLMETVFTWLTSTSQNW